MGWWSSVCSWVSNAVSTVTRVVKSVASTVSKVWEGAKNVVRSVYNGAKNIVNKAVSFVKKGVEFVSNKVKQASDWFWNTSLGKGITKVKTSIESAIQWGKDKFQRASNWFWNTSLGKGITRVKDFIMDKTPIGSAIRWGRDTIAKTSDWFFKETWLGRTVSKGCQMWNNCALGKFVNNYVVPVAKVGSLLVGGFGMAGGLVGRCFTTAGNIASHYDNIRNLPTYVKGKLLDNPLTNKLTGMAYDSYEQLSSKISPYVERARDYYSSTREKILQNPYVSACLDSTSYIKQKVSPYISAGYNRVESYIREYTPSFLYKGANILSSSYDKLKYVASGVKQVTSSYLKPYTDRFNHSTLGRNINACTQFASNYPLRAAKWVASKTVIPPINYIGSKISDRLKKTTIYEAYRKGGDQHSIQKINTQFKPILARQNKENGQSSQKLLGSYFQKYGQSEKSINKVRQMFQTIQYPTSLSPSSTPPVLNHFIQNGQVKLKDISFNAQPSEQRKSTIVGKMRVENKTEKEINFKIESGQMFGCQEFRKSQHTVVKGMSGYLRAKQEKEFLLDAFCGDVSLKWPRDDHNYAMTSLKLKGFHDQIDQKQVWKTTG